MDTSPVRWFSTASSSCKSSRLPATEALSMPLLVTVDAPNFAKNVTRRAHRGLPMAIAVVPESTPRRAFAAGPRGFRFDLLRHTRHIEYCASSPHLTWVLRGTCYSQVQRCACRSEREFVVRNPGHEEILAASLTANQKRLQNMLRGT